jgi:hypothetical protein
MLQEGESAIGFNKLHKFSTLKREGRGEKSAQRHLKLVPILSKLQQQVIHKMGKLPYEIYKCFDDPFRGAQEF